MAMYVIFVLGLDLDGEKKGLGVVAVVCNVASKALNLSFISFL